MKEKTDDVLDMEFHHRPLLKAWQDLGFDAAMCTKLCDIAMDGDHNIAKAMGFEMVNQGQVFPFGEGLVEGDCEQPLRNFGHLGRHGMKAADVEILIMMIGK